MAGETKPTGESEPWIKPITAADLMEDFEGYADWLVESGIARSDDYGVIRPIYGGPLGRRSLVIEPVTNLTHIFNFTLTGNHGSDTTFYSIKFKSNHDNHRREISKKRAEFSAISYDNQGNQVDSWFFIRDTIHPGDRETIAFIGDMAEVIRGSREIAEDAPIGTFPAGYYE